MPRYGQATQVGPTHRALLHSALPEEDFAASHEPSSSSSARSTRRRKCQVRATQNDYHSPRQRIRANPPGGELQKTRGPDREPYLGFRASGVFKKGPPPHHRSGRTRAKHHSWVFRLATAAATFFEETPVCHRRVLGRALRSALCGGAGSWLTSIRASAENCRHIFTAREIYSGAPTPAWGLRSPST